ncbi:hypothetical protein [Eisenbergiella sp.]
MNLDIGNNAALKFKNGLRLPHSIMRKMSINSQTTPQTVCFGLFELFPTIFGGKKVHLYALKK